MHHAYSKCRSMELGSGVNNKTINISLLAELLCRQMGEVNESDRRVGYSKCASMELGSEVNNNYKHFSLLAELLCRHK